MELRLIRRLVPLLIALTAAACASSQPRAELHEVGTRYLDTLIRSVRSAPELEHAIWGIRIEAEDGSVIADENGEKLFIPASNRKLFAAAFIAECEGLDRTIPTVFSIDGDVRDASLEGSLIVSGSGDPSLGGRYEADRDLRFAPLIEALRREGIRSIRGDVIADVSAFDDEIVPPSWRVGNLRYRSSARVDALAFNENVAGVHLRPSRCEEISVTSDPAFVKSLARIDCGTATQIEFEADRENRIAVIGTLAPTRGASIDLVPVADPALYTAQAVIDLLERHGMTVNGGPMVVRERRGLARTVATIESPPMYLLLTTVLKSSQNLYTEMLLKRMSLGSKPASYAASLAREREFLTTVVGLDSAEFNFADGSGLSSANLATPNAIVRLIRYLDHPERRAVYHDLLATPGEGGTLRSRLTFLTDRMRGKTGTLADTSALSGYVIGREGERRYFSILVNHHLADSDRVERAIDQIVEGIARY